MSPGIPTVGILIRFCIALGIITIKIYEWQKFEASAIVFCHVVESDFVFQFPAVLNQFPKVRVSHSYLRE